MANKTIPQLDPVVTAAQTDKFIVRQSGDFEDKHVDMSVMQLALQITESQITDLQAYLTVEANDLTAAVVWDDIPDANVPESAVTQHEAALTITESQISDLQAYLLDITGESLADLSDVAQVTPTQFHALARNAGNTGWESRLLVEADISDLQSYLTAEANDLTAAVVWDDIPDANVPESAVTQHEAALTITESQISDLAHTVGVSGLGIWKYRTETTAPPASGQIRFNNANVSLATEFYLHETNEGGVDVSTFIELLLQDGSALFIQDKTDAGNSILIEISSSTDNGVYRTYGIQSVTEQGTEPGQNDDVILLTTGLASAGGVVEVNDLTAAVTWDDIPDANVPQSAVTQHVAAIDHDQLLNFAANEHFTQAAISITESQVSDLQAYLLDITGENIADLADVSQVSPTQFHVIARNAGNTAWESRLLVEADISDLGHTAEVNDLSAAVTWVNVPDANITESSVTQHEAALTITESQISDLGAYLLDITGESLADLSDVAQVSPTQFHAVARNAGNTGWESRLLVEADISDLQSYLTSFTETNDLSAAVTWVNVPDANITQSSVTQHVAAIDHDALLNFAANEHFTQAAISITESQISDLQSYLLNIVEDLTPQLGADLDTNGFDIINSSAVTLPLTVQAGTDGSGNGGTLTLRAGASGGSSTKGGSVAIEATNGAGGGAEGGDVTLTAGNASGSGDDGGDFLAMAGAGVGGGGTGGNATVEAGTHNGGGIGGIASLIGGEGNNGTGTGGVARVIGGLGGTNGGDGGNTEITGGAGVSAASDGDGGDVIIAGGLAGGAAADGDVIVQLGGVEFARFNEGGANRQLILEQNNAPALPTLAFGDGDSGIIETVDDQLGITLAGVQRWFWSGDVFGSLNGAGPALVNVAAAIATPTVLVDRGDSNSGFGGNGADAVTVIVGGVTAHTWTETNLGVLQAIDFGGGITAFATGGQASATQLNRSNNLLNIVATAGDSVKLPPTFIFGTVVEIKNDGAAAADVFPATGDDLGLGTNVAFSLAVGQSVSFIATVANATWSRWSVDPGSNGAVINDSLQIRRTTNYTLTTAFVDITFDATDVETDAAVLEHNNTNTDDIDFKVAGTYEITVDGEVISTAASGDPVISLDARFRLNDTGTEIAGSLIGPYAVRDGSIGGDDGNFKIKFSNTFQVTVSASDKATLQLGKTEISGSDTFNVSRLCVKAKRLT